MKNKTKIVVLAGLVILLLVAIRTCLSKEQKKESAPVISNNNLITNPPLPDLDIPYQTFPMILISTFPELSSLM